MSASEHARNGANSVVRYWREILQTFIALVMLTMATTGFQMYSTMQVMQAKMDTVATQQSVDSLNSRMDRRADQMDRTMDMQNRRINRLEEAVWGNES